MAKLVNDVTVINQQTSEGLYEELSLDLILSWFRLTTTRTSVFKNFVSLPQELADVQLPSVYLSRNFF